MPLEVPDSLRGLLSLFRPCFTARGFETFAALVVGQLTRIGRHTITGCLAATGLAAVWHHSRAHRFFAAVRWSPDRLGLTALELVVRRFGGGGRAPLCLAIDDTLLKRFGPRVFGRCLHYDSATQANTKRRIAWGNSWVVAGVIIELPFMERPLCLPVLFRLWRPGRGPTQVALACELVRMVALAYPDRRLDVLADGAYQGRELAPSKLPPNVCLIVRARRDSRLFRPPPRRRPGHPGRPPKKGDKLPLARELAATGRRWRRRQVKRSRAAQTVELLEQQGLWWKGWREAPVKLVAIRDPRAPDQLDTVILASDPQLSAERIVELYARRWAIEVAFRDAKQFGRVGEAQNRTRRAVERTAPFAFLCLTLAIVWYALCGHDPDDVTDRRRRSPWYRTKRQPSVADMLAKLRRTVIATRISTTMGQAANDPKLAALAQAWEAAAA